MSRGISPTQPNHPLLKLHSGSSVGLTCFNETHRQHAWEKERHRQCIRKLCSHPCCSLLCKGSNKHVLQIFTQSDAHVFSSHTQSTPLTYQYVMVISIHSLTWRNSQYHPNDLLSPAQHQPNKVEYHDRNHKNILWTLDYKSNIYNDMCYCFWVKITYAHQGWIYLIKNTVKYCEILLQFKNTAFYCNIFSNMYNCGGI